MCSSKIVKGGGPEATREAMESHAWENLGPEQQRDCRALEYGAVRIKGT